MLLQESSDLNRKAGSVSDDVRKEEAASEDEILVEVEVGPVALASRTRNRGLPTACYAIRTRVSEQMDFQVVLSQQRYYQVNDYSALFKVVGSCPT